MRDDTLPSPRYLTTRQAAAYLQVSERSIFNLRKSGVIPSVMLGTSVRFDIKDLNAAIARTKQGGNER